MSDTIPDSVSPDMLRGLLGKDLPDSSCIPRLDFGGRLGAPCDLQFAISLMVAQSAGGVNIVQTMVAAMHLLSEAQLQLQERFQSLKDGDDPDIEGAPPEVRAAIVDDIGKHCAVLNSSVTCLEQVLAGLSGFACHHRLRHLVETGAIKPGPVSRIDVLSRLLISGELLETLSLTREQVNNYLESQKL